MFREPQKYLAYSILALFVFSACGKRLSSGPSVVSCDGPNPPASCVVGGGGTTGYGTSGFTVVDFGADDVMNASAQTPDGKLIIVGAKNVGSSTLKQQVAITRLNADGSLDTSFGGSGKVAIDVSSYSDEGRAVAVLGTGKILVAGNYGVMGNEATPRVHTHWFVLRLSSDGTLDSTFGTSGIARTIPSPGNFDDDLRALSVSSGGSIFIAGNAAGHTAIAKYNSDGKTLDTTFGTSGTKIISVADFDGIFRLAFYGDGRILTFGWAVFSNGTGQVNHFCVGRLSATGVPDTTFGGSGNGGFAKISMGYESAGTSGVLAPSGNIYIVGWQHNGATSASPYVFGIASLDSTGTLRSGFGSAGKTTASFGSVKDIPVDIALNSDESLVVVGSSQVGADGPTASFRLALTKYSSVGVMDTSFGTTGQVSIQRNSAATDGRSVSIASDGKIVVAGTAKATTYDFLATRFTASGALDN